ncbi:Butyryl-CoA dehydrogenase [Rhodococcus wratislaviensis]|uniref:Butyryl-CoA dehydrogenase n=1 Tax=Rhodococcus wratislaviensis TaxID=44752 RepID=A0A402CF29_RHOWR|nr:acyl-CoA dehydrogenase family protein [Rhodococcus wratislaviensis]GCE42157.1 Butyryl-CoA dehydrogenase [Rhodococcus wratislaviensis]
MSIMLIDNAGATPAAMACENSDTGADTAFRLAIRSWIEENLPSDWRGRSFGATDESLSEQRRKFGALLGRAGWLTANWPTSVGGLGASAARRIAVLEELVAAGAPEPMNSNSLGIFAPTLIKYGTPDQHRKFLPDMVTHNAIWCQGFSEPEAGSDLAAISTRGEIVGDQLVITGQKIWTSYAHLADFCYILVRTERSEKRHSGLTLAILPMHQDAVDVRPLRNIAGTDEFCEVFLDGATTPMTNIVGEPGNGWSMAMYALSQERSVGLAQRSLKLRAEFTALAEIAGRELTEGNLRDNDPILTGGMVDAYVRSLVTTSMVRRAIDLDAAGKDIGTVAAMAKVFWSESHQEQMGLAAHILGSDFVSGNGVGSDWYRASVFTRAETIYGGTTQIQRNVLARSLGLPKGK